jgi:hypothetical protein
MNAISKTNVRNKSPNSSVDKASKGWLGSPVLIPGEDAGEYDQFAERIRGALKPSNAIEELYVDDAIFHGWEVRRWRRAKGGLLLASGPAAMKRLLGRVAVEALAETLAEGWAKREPDAVAKVEGLLSSAGLTYDATMAEAMAAKIDLMAGFDQLAGAAEGRFTIALKELDRYRAGAAKVVRDIVDAEFEDVEAPAKVGPARDE